MPPREPDLGTVQSVAGIFAGGKGRKGFLRRLLWAPVDVLLQAMQVSTLEYRLRIEEGRAAAARGECEQLRAEVRGLAAEAAEARGERNDARRVAEAVIAERDAARAERDALRRCWDAQAAEVERAQGRADAAERGHALLVAQRDAAYKERDTAHRRGDCLSRRAAHARDLLTAIHEPCLHPSTCRSCAALAWLRGEHDPHEPRALHCDDVPDGGRA